VTFLKKHYEKIILVFFLLVFIITMIQLILIVRNSSNISVEDLKFETRPPDYPKIDLTKYELADIFAKEKMWKKISSRKPDSLNYTDLLVPYHSAVCPHCKNIIPIADFNENKKCSLCGGVLTPIGQEQIDTEKDSDSDGIPDEKEKELGLNPNNPADADEDMDKDGFSNIFEYKQSTNLKDPKSHPPFAMRLFVESIDRRKLHFFLKKIVRKGGSKESWDIYTVEWNSDKGKMDDKFRKIGSDILIDGTIYKIIDIIPKEIEHFDSRTNTKIPEDVSQIVIKAAKDDPITVNMKSYAYENKETIVISDAYTNQKFKLILNENFSVPNPETGEEETYTLTKIIDRDALKVQIIDEKSKQVFDIGPEPTHRVKQKETFISPENITNPEEIPF